MKRRCFILFLAMAVCGCKTGIPNPLNSIKPDYSELPADSLRAAAAAIEAGVKQGNRELDPASVTGIRIDSDEVLQAIRTRAARQELVDEFLNSGHAYERNNGLLSILRTSAYKKFGTSRDRDRNALLFMGENGNRWAIYEGILKLNNFSGRSLDAIQKIFYEARVAQLEPGQKYQNEAGEIVTK